MSHINQRIAELSGISRAPSASIPYDVVMSRPQKLSRPQILNRMVAALALVLFAPQTFAQDWAATATISTTMGVTGSRLCLGEASRGDIGCPTYAPYVSATTGNVGIGTSTPAYSLDIIPANNYMRLGASDSVGELLLGNGTSSPGFYAPAVFGRPINPARYMTILSEIQSADDTGTNAALLIGARVSPSNLVGTRPTIAFRNNTRTDMLITAAGKVGISSTSPQAALDVGGTVRLGNGAETCDASHTGAIRYVSNEFYICRNGTSWESLTSIGTGGSVGDRITSGTTGVIVNGTGYISLTTGGTTTGYFDTAGRLVAPGISLTTANGISSTNGYFSNRLGIGTTTPAYPLDINGTARASGEVISTGANQFRMVQGNYGAFWRNDGATLYLLLTGSGDQYGAWNTLRPFMVNLATGAVTMNQGLTVGGSVAATSFSGDGSGLTNVTATNANTLDSLDSTAFVLKSGSTMTGTLQVPYLNVAAQGVEGGEIQLLKGTGQSNLAGNVVFDTVSDVVRLYEAGGSYRQFNFNLVTGALSGPAGTFWHNGNDGAGSGLDADTVDGVQASGLLTKAGVTAGNTCIGNGTTVDCSDSNVGTKNDITTRTPSGFWQTDTATTGEGWPATTNGWYHLMTATHSNTGNYYSMQFAGDFASSNNIFYRATSGSGATGWNRLWHSGNDGSGSGLDADTLDGVDSAALLRSGQAYSGDNVLTIAGTAASNGAWSPGLEVREVGLVGNGSADSSYAPGITFHWGATVANAIKMYSDGSFRFRTDSADASAYSNIFANNLWLTGVGDWISNRLGQDVRAGATPNFANIWVNSLGGYATDVFMGKIINTWHNSSEGAARFYFANGGRTYIRANNGDGVIATFRGGDEVDKVHIAQDGNIWMAWLGDWMSNRLGQDVRSGASVNFDIMDAVRLRLGGARYDTPINNGVIRVVPNSSGEFGINIRQASGQTANLLNFFDTGNNTIARVTASGNVAGTGAYTTLSDRRSKHDIADATDVGLATIEALRPRYYVRNGQTERQLGFIAQEVEEVLPIAVTYMDPDKPETSYKAIQSEALVPVLVNAVKELRAENDALRFKIDAANDNHARELDAIRREIQSLKQGR